MNDGATGAAAAPDGPHPAPWPAPVAVPAPVVESAPVVDRQARPDERRPDERRTDASRPDGTRLDAQRTDAPPTTGGPATDPPFDRIIVLATRLLHASSAFVNLAENRRSFSASRPDAPKTPTAVARRISRAVMRAGGPLLVDDTRVDRIIKNTEAIVDEGVGAWAGAPVRGADGAILGAVCVTDTERRSWVAEDARLLEDLAGIVADEIESSRSAREAQRSGTLLASVLTEAPVGFALVDGDLRYELINETLADINGVPIAETLGRTIFDVVPDVASDVAAILRGVLATGESVTGIEVTGSTPAQPGVERIWSVSYYRLDMDDGHHAAMLVEETTARIKSHRRAQRLASISSALAKADTLSDIEEVVVHEIAAYFEASVALVGHWDDDTRSVSILASAGVKDSMSISELAMDDDAPYAEAARTGRIVVVSDLADRRARFSSEVGSELVAEAVVPCLNGDGTFIGAMTIGWDRAIAADDFPIAQLLTVGGLVASSFERNRLNRHRQQLVDALQQTVVAAPAVRDGMEVVVRYRPANGSLGFGGDWYDIVAIDEDRTALVIGDVAGHDPIAAARMSQISSIVGQLLLSDVEPADVFAQAERSMLARHIDAMATVGVVIVDTRRRTLTAMSAGHPPGFLISPDGGVRPLVPALRPPLRGFGTVTEGLRAVPYEPGAELVLFSDGLVETRRGDISDDLQRLCDHLATKHDVGLDDLADKLLADFAPARSQFDDIALLLTRFD